MYALLMQGSFTGPRIFWSGSSLRTEATGYGLVIVIKLLGDLNMGRVGMGLNLGFFRVAFL